MSVDVVVGGTAVVVHRISVDGRPSSAAATVYDPSGSSLGSAVATVDTVNTTTSGAVSAAATSVTLASAVGVTARRSYLLRDSHGVSERVRVVSVSGSTVTLTEPLHYDYASGSTFAGLVVSVALTATHTATLGQGYRIDLTYSISGTSYAVSEWFNVVKRVLICTLTTDRLKELASGRARAIEQWLAAPGVDYETAIGVAIEEVIADLRAREMRPDAILEPVAIERAVAKRVIVKIAQEGTIPEVFRTDPFKYLDSVRGEYNGAIDAALALARVDETPDATTTEVSNEEEETYGITLHR